MIISPLEDTDTKMENPGPTKDKIVQKIKEATNILVTVSSNPTVDQLAATIGLTLLLNKLGKHGTAIFSGVVPSTIEFLQPEKTIEKNTDSLQDFIISLDKSKADKLRYKVEDKLVRIFITPYQASLSEKDLIFGQGDFNVDVVIALGIKNIQQVDQAIAAHGRILHDAIVISLNTDASGDIGTINWVDNKASSLCEMIVTLVELMKDSSLLDGQMATALLTGIVSQTERFSNSKTTSVTMNLSARLMLAGANQQLVASKLGAEEEAKRIAAAKAANDAATEAARIAAAKAANDAATAAARIAATEAAKNVQLASKTLAIPSAPIQLPTPSTAEKPMTSVATDGLLQIKHDEETHAPVKNLVDLKKMIQENDSDDGIDKINIDDKGIISKLEVLIAKEENKKKEQSQEPGLSNQKSLSHTGLLVDTISNDEYLSPPSALKNSRLIIGPPTLGGVLNYNSINPTENPNPLFTHDTGKNPISSNSLATSDGIAQASNIAPTETNPQTLSDLEVRVHSPHLQQQSNEQNSGSSEPTDRLKGARNAVSDAVSSIPTSTLEPLTALNANPIELNKVHGTQNNLEGMTNQPSTENSETPFIGSSSRIVPTTQPIDSTKSPMNDPASPPPVPPPLMPPPSAVL